MTFDSNLTTDVKSHKTRQLNTYLIQLLIRRKCILFWLDLSIFPYWTPWMLKANIWVVSSLNILCYLLVGRFLKTKKTRKQEKNVFWLIKNEDKIVGGHLKLYIYYINKEQKLVLIYLELIFTGIKTERWKAAEVRLSLLGLKQVGKIVQGLRPVRRWFVLGLKQG